jgi:transposase-like protein
LRAEGKCPAGSEAPAGQYLNNAVVADHGKLKPLIKPMRGFKTLNTDYATINAYNKSETRYRELIQAWHRHAGCASYSKGDL